MHHYSLRAGGVEGQGDFLRYARVMHSGQRLPTVGPSLDTTLPDRLLAINPELVTEFLVEFLRDEVQRQRKMEKVVVGLSGGVDSAVTTYLAAKAFGKDNVIVVRLPYKISSQDSLDHAGLVAKDLGLEMRTIDITKMVDGYVSEAEPDISPARLGNVCARCRMVALYDLSAKVGGIPLGTGNKTERFFGYFTWHADDAPAVNPLGDLYKTQVWALAKHLGVPDVIVNKPPTADLQKGQTDEGDFGMSYHTADRILALMLEGFTVPRTVAYGLDEEDVRRVYQKVAATHWKRKLPTVAMISDTAINEYYLRPVDFRTCPPDQLS